MTTEWFVDAVGGSNRANGRTAATALQSAREWLWRVGGTEAVLYEPTVLHWLSTPDHPEFDPLVFRPVIAQGGSFTLCCAATAVGSTTLGTVMPKNRATGTLLSAPVAGALPGDTIVNVTRGGSRAFADVAALSQPCAENASALASQPAMDDSWATGDAVQIVRPAQIVIGALLPTVLTAVDEVPFSAGIYCFLVNAWVPNTCPGGAANGCSKTLLNRGVRATQCRFDGYVSTEGLYIGAEGNFVNCTLLGGSALDSVYTYAGVLAGTDLFGVQYSGVLDGDVIVHGVVSMNSPLFDYNQIGCVYSDAVDFAIAGDTIILGDVGDGVLWGPVALDLTESSHVLTYNAPASSSFQGGVSFTPDAARSLSGEILPMSTAMLDGALAGHALFDTGARITDGTWAEPSAWVSGGARRGPARRPPRHLRGRRVRRVRPR